jgi:hypothetical protein
MPSRAAAIAGTQAGFRRAPRQSEQCLRRATPVRRRIATRPMWGAFVTPNRRSLQAIIAAQAVSADMISRSRPSRANSTRTIAPSRQRSSRGSDWPAPRSPIAARPCPRRCSRDVAGVTRRTGDPVRPPEALRLLGVNACFTARTQHSAHQRGDAARDADRAGIDDRTDRRLQSRSLRPAIWAGRVGSGARRDGSRPR